MKRASIFARFLALCVDWFILSIFGILVFVSVLAGYIFGSGGSLLDGIDTRLGLLFKTFIFCSIFIITFYFTYLTMKGRSTVGKSIFNIKVLKGDGAELGFLRSLSRFTVYVFSASAFFIGFIMALFLRGRALHDILADTQVVEEEQ
ncbi:MAG: RDD family protein [Proteobacteria bacterium]|nr:RDD family protein [Pseudomonadota bacterium]